MLDGALENVGDVFLQHIAALDELERRGPRGGRYTHRGSGIVLRLTAADRGRARGRRWFSQTGCTTRSRPLTDRVRQSTRPDSSTPRASPGGTAMSGSRMPARTLPSASTAGTRTTKGLPTSGGSTLTMPFAQSGPKFRWNARSGCCGRSKPGIAGQPVRSGVVSVPSAKPGIRAWRRRDVVGDPSIERAKECARRLERCSSGFSAARADHRRRPGSTPRGKRPARRAAPTRSCRCACSCGQIRVAGCRWDRCGRASRRG